MVAALIIESEFNNRGGEWVPAEPIFCVGYREAAVILRNDCAPNSRYHSRARLVGQNIKPDLAYEFQAEYQLELPDDWLGARFEAVA